jgi:hypothetical protein
MNLKTVARLGDSVRLLKPTSVSVSSTFDENRSAMSQPEEAEEVPIPAGESLAGRIETALAICLRLLHSLTV